MNKPVAEQFSSVKEFEEFYNKKRQKERRDMFAAAIVQGRMARGWQIMDVVDDLSINVDVIIAELDKEESK